MTKFNGQEYPEETTVGQLVANIKMKYGYDEYAEGFKTTLQDGEEKEDKPFAEQLIEEVAGTNPLHILPLLNTQEERGIKTPHSFKCINCGREQHIYKTVILILCGCGYKMEPMKGGKN